MRVITHKVSLAAYLGLDGQTFIEAKRVSANKVNFHFDSEIEISEWEKRFLNSRDRKYNAELVQYQNIKRKTI